MELHACVVSAGWMVGWMESTGWNYTPVWCLLDGWMDGWMDGWSPLDGSTHLCGVCWMDGWMGGVHWMDLHACVVSAGWMDGSTRLLDGSTTITERVKETPNPTDAYIVLSFL